MQAQGSDFWFWFLTEAFFAAFVAVLLYYFFVRNPKINKYRKPRREDEED